jgi:RimJ/RimL family protein N-acetyltransferase
VPRLFLPSEPLTDGVVALRALRHDDVPAMTKACADPEIARWTTIPADYTEADAHAYLRGQDDRLRAGESLGLAIADATTDELTGAIGLTHLEWEDARAEIGYWVAPWARRRGIAGRALRLMSGWSFSALGLLRLDLLPYAGNEISERVAERAGYTREGLLRSYREAKHGRADMVMYSLLAGDPR